MRLLPVVSPCEGDYLCRCFSADTSSVNASIQSRCEPCGPLVMKSPHEAHRGYFPDAAPEVFGSSRVTRTGAPLGRSPLDLLIRVLGACHRARAAGSVT